MTAPVVVALGPARVDLTGIRAGDRNLMLLTICAGGVPVDLTGATITAQARATADAPTVAVEGIITVTAPLEGELTLEWPGDEVADAITAGTVFRGVWDLQLDTGLGVTTIIAGSFLAELDVTRP